MLETLVAVGTGAPLATPGVQLVAAFRLSSWRDKGIAEIVWAINALGRRDVHLTICGSGEPRPGCASSSTRTRGAFCPQISDLELAQQFVTADLFAGHPGQDRPARLWRGIQSGPDRSSRRRYSGDSARVRRVMPVPIMSRSRKGKMLAK